MRFHSVSVLLWGILLQYTDAVRHHILTKSWDEAQEDCLSYQRIAANRSEHFRSHHYPGEDSLTKELVFCIALNLRAYDPARNVVRVEVLGKFFQPDPDDADNVERTNECLRTVDQKPPAVVGCRRSEFYSSAVDTVFEAFRCFYYHFGNLNQAAPPLPPTDLELEQVREECTRIVCLPVELLRDRLHLKEHPLWDRFRRCVALRTGFSGVEHEGTAQYGTRDEYYHS
ncbi:general odorant-binding protein 69-like [Anopheles ziemanni]|uniref:general odorant-binding protein 69-like n=1 Tax=Anopheles coustani TaxID=139045 RepID=UPI002657D04C|nr:general odorant-binding protein 69-like [Anopheles coustani]XP_058169409.1 general odorant-binding protein 69-like [Anopheles ziemanni]